MVKKERGALLTFWLIFMLISNGIVALIYLLGGKFLVSVLPTISLGVIYFFGVFTLLNIIFLIYLFKWKKWAFFALCGNVGIIFVINLVIGIKFITALRGLIGILILYLIMKSRWNLFK